MTQKIEIKPRRAGELPSAIHLFVDGHEVKGIRSLRYKVDPNEIPHLVLDLNAIDISIDSECVVFQKGFGEIRIGGQDEEIPEPRKDEFGE